jgi:branched-chain amino acid aminotransferase
MNGSLVKWDDARIHILSHVIHYGSSVFEGFRVYKTKNGPAAFRLRDHTIRLFNSAKIYYMDIPYTYEEIDNAVLGLVKANNFEECYVRPLVYRGYGRRGVDPTGSPIDVAIATWQWGQYLGPDAVDNGVSVCVSSWNRFAPNTMPSFSKSGANYMNSQLIKMEAKRHGYVEGIALDSYGYVSEGSGENIFVVYKGELLTPSFDSAILAGITRDSVIQLAQGMGLTVKETKIPRELLYIAEEVFFTGSAAEVTPISRVDQVQVGKEKSDRLPRSYKAHSLVL